MVAKMSLAGQLGNNEGFLFDTRGGALLLGMF